MKIHTLFVAFIAAVMTASCTQSGPERHAEEAASLSVSEVRQLGRLNLAEMTVTKMGTIDDLKLSDAETSKQQLAAIWNAMKIGTRKGAYSYDTYLRAYIDLDNLSADDLKLDTVSRTAQLSLPPIHTEIVGRDGSLREEHYRVTGLRSNISATERAALKEKMSAQLKEEIASDAEFERLLSDRARHRATAYFDSLFSTRGYTADISFKK